MTYIGAPTMSKCQKWTTPPSLIVWLEDRFNMELELDVCADLNNTKAPRFFTEEDNALEQNWFARHAFMNPPFGHGGKMQKTFFEHAVNEVHVMNNCLNLWALVPARTDTKLFHEIIVPHANKIYFIKGRLNFGGHNNVEGANAPFPSMLVHFTCEEEPSSSRHYQKFDTLELSPAVRGF